MAIRNKRDDRGSPYLSPRPCPIGFPCMPLSRMREEEEANRAATQSWNLRKTSACKHIEDIVPRDGVKGLLRVKLEQQHQSVAVESATIIAGKNKVVMDALSLDEHALGVGDQGAHVRRQSVCQNFSDNISNGME